MYAIALVVAVILFVIYRLTRQAGPGPDARADWEPGQVAREVAGVAERSLRRPEEASPVAARSPLTGRVLGELMARLGADREVAREELRRMGFDTDAPPKGATQQAQRPDLKVYRAGGETREALERALLVGIQIARIDDDYGRVGDDYLALDALERRAEAIEVELFGEGRRERYVLYGKAALALQDMLQGEPEGARKEAIRRLLGAFDEQVQALQAELSRSMAEVPEPDTLQWGDSRDRRLYYFKMGVTNSLRRSGLLESLGHLYRYQGVNYGVVEAYDLAAQECPQLALANRMGIDRLLRLGPAEVQALVQQALPEGGQP